MLSLDLKSEVYIFREINMSFHQEIVILLILVSYIEKRSPEKCFVQCISESVVSRNFFNKGVPTAYRVNKC